MGWWRQFLVMLDIVDEVVPAVQVETQREPEPVLLDEAVRGRLVDAVASAKFRRGIRYWPGGDVGAEALYGLRTGMAWLNKILSGNQVLPVEQVLAEMAQLAAKTSMGEDDEGFKVGAAGTVRWILTDEMRPFGACAMISAACLQDVEHLSEQALRELQREEG